MAIRHWGRGGLALLLAACGGALAGCAGVATAEPRNLQIAKREVRAYFDRGDYQRDVAAVARQAQEWVERRATQGGAGLTVVFDVDETLLSNWAYFLAQDFGYVPAAWRQWVEEARAPAIEPVREVLRAARRAGLEVVLITGRRERDRAGTERNLRAVACGDYTQLLCQPNDGSGSSADFKTAQRRALAAQGKVIIANIGDQESDLAGGFAERTFKLPNPFYLME